MKPADWTLGGRYFDAQAHAHAAEGRLELSHRPFEWILHSVIALEGQRLEHTYLIEPLDGARRARWRSVHSAWGNLVGTLDVAGRRIFVAFHSSDGQWMGSETFTQSEDRTYQIQGEIHRQGPLLWSWSLAMKPCLA